MYARPLLWRQLPVGQQQLAAADAVATACGRITAACRSSNLQQPQVAVARQLAGESASAEESIPIETRGGRACSPGHRRMYGITVGETFRCLEGGRSEGITPMSRFYPVWRASRGDHFFLVRRRQQNCRRGEVHSLRQLTAAAAKSSAVYKRYVFFVLLPNRFYSLECREGY